MTTITETQHNVLAITEPLFPSITPQATTLLMSENQILKELKRKSLYNPTSLRRAIYNEAVRLDIDESEMVKELMKEPWLVFRLKENTPIQQLRSIQTCRHAYHLDQIGLFDMGSWSRETECGTSYCIAGSACALYRSGPNIYLYSDEGQAIMGPFWRKIFHCDNDLGSFAVNYVLRLAEKRGFLRIDQ